MYSDTSQDIKERLHKIRQVYIYEVRLVIKYLPMPLLFRFWLLQVNLFCIVVVVFIFAVVFRVQFFTRDVAEEVISCSREDFVGNRGPDL